MTNHNKHAGKSEYDLIAAVNMIEKSISPSSMEYLLSFTDPGQLRALVDKTPWITYDITKHYDLWAIKNAMNLILTHFEIMPSPFSDDLSEAWISTHILVPVIDYVLMDVILISRDAAGQIKAIQDSNVLFREVKDSLNVILLTLPNTEEARQIFVLRILSSAETGKIYLMDNSSWLQTYRCFDIGIFWLPRTFGNKNYLLLTLKGKGQALDLAPQFFVRFNDSENARKTISQRKSIQPALFRHILNSFREGARAGRPFECRANIIAVDTLERNPPWYDQSS
ncbi:hypothetical protein G9A89_000042 [Geosiphon pyriformis]|nr:hypothetical protein G9A89_000042 [Geosiphon pyriformis]